MAVKIEIARAQLGTALDLFIRDADPISVHALACGGSEIVEGLAEQAQIPTLSTHIMSTFPNMDYRAVRRVKNQYWNAIKHFYTLNGKAIRDDEELMAGFSDTSNDAVLFMGWLDYLLLTKRLPFEAQVFQLWWYATNPQRMNPNVDPRPWDAVFPDVASKSRLHQKQLLRDAITKWAHDPELKADPRTENRPL